MDINLLGERDELPIPILVNDDFDLSFEIDGLSLAYDNICKEYKVLNKINSDCVKINGLLGGRPPRIFSQYGTSRFPVW